MRATSELPLQPGTMAYGRNLILVWDVVETAEGFDYECMEVPKSSTEDDILRVLEAVGLDGNTQLEVLLQDATEGINGC